MTELDEAPHPAERARSIALAVCPEALPVVVPAQGGLADATVLEAEHEVVVATPRGTLGALAAWVALRDRGSLRIIVLGDTERVGRLAAALRAEPVRLEVVTPAGLGAVQPWSAPEVPVVRWREDAWLDRLVDALLPIAPVTVSALPDAVVVESAGVWLGGRWGPTPVVGVDPRDWLMRSEQHLSEDALLGEAVELARSLLETSGRVARAYCTPRARARRARERWLTRRGLEPLEPDGVIELGGRAFAIDASGAVWGFGLPTDPWLAVEARALGGDPTRPIYLVTEGRLGPSVRIASAFGPFEVIEE